jgi:hypothetical protein
MVLSGKGFVPGLLSVVFFGGGGLLIAYKFLRHPVTFVLTKDGTEQRYPQGSIHILWADIEQVGIFRAATSKMVGMRLTTYERYLRNMSPELMEIIRKRLPYVKLAARAASMLEVSGGVGVLLGHDQEAMKDFGEVGGIAEALAWSRAKTGYDVAFQRLDFDRSADEFSALLDQYRLAARTTVRSSPPRAKPQH